LLYNYAGYVHHRLSVRGAVEMITPLLTLSPEAVEEDGEFRHPYLLRRDFALVADQDPFSPPHFAVCHTPLPANFCTCGRYALFEAEIEALWS
jgi:hypothetical protein